MKTRTERERERVRCSNFGLLVNENYGKRGAVLEWVGGVVPESKAKHTPT